MLINFKERLIFVRTTKTASSSIIDSLFEFFKNDEIIDFGDIKLSNGVFCLTDNLKNKHKNAFLFLKYFFERYHLSYKALDNACNFDLSDFTIVTSIRNPYDHALSRYLYEENIFKDYKNNQLKINSLIDFKKFFRSLIFSVLPKHHISFSLYLIIAYKPYHLYYYNNGQDLSDISLKVENLENDLKNLIYKISPEKIKYFNISH